MSDPVAYFARLRPGESVANPSWVLRRTTTDAGVSDELLGRDGQWRPTSMLADAERGDLPGTLRGMGGALGRVLTNGFRKRYAGGGARVGAAAGRGVHVAAGVGPGG